MTTIDSATRRIPKATYVPLRVDQPTSTGGSAVVKFGFVRNLALQPGEVDAVRASIADLSVRPPSPGEAPWEELKSFEGAPLPSQLPAPSVFAAIPAAALRDFGKRLTELRRRALELARGALARTNATGLVATDSAVGLAFNAFNSSLAANKGFEANVSATPIGMLNLERLEMTPAGIERGELLATIPLAPNEKTAVIQKEWSVTTKEFTSIVTDSLESISETGVTENTELAQSTASQVQHSNQFNITSSVSGGVGFVTGSVAASFGSQDADSRSASDSRKHAIETTRKASSRVKQEHKTTISTTTVTGTSETTTRTLENPSATEPMRIDYFSLIRKWRVRLFRYGLRMTYDIAIPEPGAAMRGIFEKLARLQARSAAPFTFPLAYSDITEQNYQQYASQYGAQVAAPPAATLVQIIGGIIPGLKNDDSDTSWHFAQLNMTVPDGYEISNVKLELMLSNVGSPRQFYVLGGGQAEDVDPNLPGRTVDLTAGNGYMAGYRGNQIVTYFVRSVGTGAAVFTVTQRATAEEKARWAASVWSALHNAAQASFFTEQQAVGAEIQTLQDKIDGVDTLTLRREESDEIMKGVLRWLLGTGFDFMPKAVVDLFVSSGADLQYGVGFTGNRLGIQPANWSTMFQYQEMVKFINEAIEWENVLHFLYSYFWDVPQSWDFIRQIRHPDATRQAFLRAGSARVVLTVRKGYEQAWMSFVELGDFSRALPPNHPYMTIAQEIAAYDDTNYPGIPPANPAGGRPALQEAVATTSAVQVAAQSAPVTIAVESSARFVVGAKVVIDTFASGVQESEIVTAVPDATHVTVARLLKLHDGSSGPFPIVQPGESGVLIAEWFEHTPTSGTDIAVTSDLSTIG